MEQEHTNCRSTASSKRVALPALVCILLFRVYLELGGWHSIFVNFQGTTSKGSHESNSDDRLSEQHLYDSEKFLFHGMHPEISPISERYPLLPLETLERYIEQHSVESLRRQPHGRRFSIAHYSCPHQAGNRLHHFTNDLILAILTNRTLLLKYWDQETCIQIGNHHIRNVCAANNMSTVSDCNPIMQPFSWMASWEEWSDTLQLDAPAMILWNKKLRYKDGDPLYPWTDVDTNRTGPADQWKTVIFQPGREATNLDMFTQLFPPNSRGQMLSRKLFALGDLFVHGMMFYNSFAFTANFISTVGATVTHPTQVSQEKDFAPVFSVAIHSRHVRRNNNGENVAKEGACLRNILAQKQKRQGCLVYLLSDRPATVSALQEFALASNCSVSTVVHDTIEKSWSSEHGSAAGAGFYQDLVNAQAARSFVGQERSSSMLLMEWIDYGRRMEAWKQGMDPSALPPLTTCLWEGKQ